MKLEVTLTSTRGLHARLAAKIVSLAHKYQSTVEVVYDDVIIDAKSLLGLLSLAIPSGENLQIITEGEDAEDVMRELQKLLSKEDK